MADDVVQPRVSVQTADFDLGTEVAALRAGDGGVGAVVAFVGTVRDRHDGAAVSAMELEHYPGMTERAIESMVDAAFARFDIRAARVVHRVGPLEPADQIVLVAVTSAHRGAAFEACEFLMDYLKTQAPFWKKEQTPAGARWVDARVTDDAAARRWGLVDPGRATPHAAIDPAARATADDDGMPGSRVEAGDGTAPPVGAAAADGSAPSGRATAADGTAPPGGAAAVDGTTPPPGSCR